MKITEIGADQIKVEASTDLKPLLELVHIPGHTTPGKAKRTVTRSATAHRTSTGIELALVFDTTLSMAQRSSATGLMHI